MRLLITLIGFQFLTTTLYGQIQVELYFKNSCDNSIIKLDFELRNTEKIDSTVFPLIESNKEFAVVPTQGTYHVTSNYLWDNLIGMFDDVIEINSSKKQVDTINIPRIKSTWDGVLHAKTPYWNYFNCEKLCDGHETDFYPNGQKRLEGEFIKGKPNHIIEYRKDGKRKFECWYIPGTSSQTRVNWYDNNGKLDEYDKYDKRKHRTIKTTYTAQGKKVTREVIKHEN